MISTPTQENDMEQMIEIDGLDFQPDPLNPMQQLCEIIELAHQCISMRKAYVNLDLFGGCDKVRVTIITDFEVIEYPNIQSWFISPSNNAWNESTKFDAEMDDQQSLQTIIDKLKEILA